MTREPLPLWDALAEIATLAPHLVRLVPEQVQDMRSDGVNLEWVLRVPAMLFVGAHHSAVCEHVDGAWVQIGHDGVGRPHVLWELHGALTAQGLDVELWSGSGQWGANIARPYDPARPDADTRIGEWKWPGAPDPAHALALAVLAALRGESAALLAAPAPESE